MTHFDTSLTDELMEPAAALLSSGENGSGTSLSFSLACGYATLSPGLNFLTLVLLAFMPSFLKIRSATKSSQLLPETFSITCPATRYMLLLYAYLLRKLEAGLTCRSRLTISA